MEKKNKTKSALKKTADILRRNTKSRLAIQKFLNDLQEQESEYLNENNQITQCVFLGALCLKPVPADIFQVTLQPISFTTQSKSGILYNNSVKTDTNSVGHGGLKSENSKKVKVKKTPRKNSKTSTIETNVFIGNICEQKPGNRILELFNNRHLSGTEKVHSESSKDKLTGKCKKDKRIKYKIKVGGILRKNKKYLSEQKGEELNFNSDNQTFHNSHPLKTSLKNTQIKIPEIKASLRHKFIQPGTREVKQCKVQIEDNNSNINNTISPLFVEKCKSDTSFKKSVTDNTIERLKKKRGIEIKKVTKMEAKSKTIPSLVSVKSLVSENGSFWDVNNKTQMGHSSSVISSFDGSNKSEQKINYVKEDSIDLLEIIDDEIEDYLEIDQNIVADLEALIPEEEIESISNTLISSTNMPNTTFNNFNTSKSISFATVNSSSSESKIEQLNEILVNTSKSIEMVEDNNFKKDIEIHKSIITHSLDNNKIGKINMLDNSTEKLIENELDDEHIKISKQKSEDILEMLNKRKGTKPLGVECEGSKLGKRVKSVQSSPRKLTAKLKKHSQVESKDISKKIRKITDFLFPIKKTDNNLIENSNLKNVSKKHKNSDQEDSKNMTVVFINKTLSNVSSDLNKESFGETRTLRSCSKKSLRVDVTKTKTIGTSNMNDIQGSMLSPENEVVFICKNDESVPQEQKIATDNMGCSLNENDVAQSNDNISKISSALSKTLTELSIQNPITDGTVQIRNVKTKPVKYCKPKKKKLIESKKINESKIEKIIDVDKLQSEKKIDSELKFDIADFPKNVEMQFSSNEDHIETHKLNILHAEPILKDIKEIHSKLENNCKKRRNEDFDKSSPCPEELTNYKKTRSEICAETEATVKNQVQAMMIISEDKIETEVNVMSECCHPNEDINLSEPISNTRTRRETAARTQKTDSMADIHKNTGSTIIEANFIKAVPEDIEKPWSLKNGKLKGNTFDSINQNSVPLHSGEEPNDNILKVKETFEITNCDYLKSVRSNQLGETNSLNGLQKKNSPCKKEVAAILNHNETILQVESTQKSAATKAISKSRFQLRRKKTEEVPNENIDLKEPIQENNTYPIQHENLSKQFVDLKSQSTLSNAHNEDGIVEINHIIPDIKEINLKTNVCRNTRRNKIDNKNSNIIPLEQLDKKMHFKKKELKGNTKKLCRLKVKGNKNIGNNKPNSLQKKIQHKTKNIKIFRTRNQIKGGRVLKRITNFRKEQRLKIIEHNNYIKASTEINENKIGISNKKGKKVIKPALIKIQSSAEIEINKEESLGKKSPILHDSTSENLINKQISSDNTIRTSDAENSGSKVALIVKHNNKIENMNNHNEKYTFRNRRNDIIGRKAIISKIHNVVNTLKKPKIIFKKKHSPSSILNNDSRMKSDHNHQLNENEIQVSSTNKIINKTSIGMDMLELPEREYTKQDCLNESEINKTESSKDELHNSKNIMASENIAFLVEEKLTETQSLTVEKAISKTRTKKTLVKSFNCKFQNDVRTPNKKKKLDEFSADTSLNMLTKTKIKTKNQLNNEKTGSINEDELLNTGKKSDILHDEKSGPDILKKFNEDNKNLSLKHVSQKREHDKSQHSVVHEVKDLSLGISQEKLNMDHSGLPEKKVQHKTEKTQLSQLDKNDSKVESPTNIVLSVVSKIKSRQKSNSKRLADIALTKSDGCINQNKRKLKTRKDEKSDTMNAVDMSSEVVAVFDQKIHTFATKNIKNDTGKLKIKDKSEYQVEVPNIQTQKTLDSFHSSNSFERTGTWISQNKTEVSSVTNIPQKKLQFTDKNKSSTLDKTLDESQPLHQYEKEDSTNSCASTRNIQESENFENIFVEGVPNGPRNNEKILSDVSLEENNDLQHPVSHSSDIHKTVIKDSLEPKKRRYRKSEPQDRKMNNKQVTRKRKNNMSEESNVNPKIEASVLKLSEVDKAEMENNCNIPYVLKEDLSNPNSELSQEIERRMQMEFNREFPNYGPSAPERYRRIYRCRICLLVCETYGKLKLHRRIHDVATPYQCQQCDKSYDDVEDLAAHLRIHKGEKFSKLLSI